MAFKEILGWGNSRKAVKWRRELKGLKGWEGLVADKD